MWQNFLGLPFKQPVLPVTAREVSPRICLTNGMHLSNAPKTCKSAGPLPTPLPIPSGILSSAQSAFCHPCIFDHLRVQAATNPEHSASGLAPAFLVELGCPGGPTKRARTLRTSKAGVVWCYVVQQYGPIPSVRLIL